MITIWSNFSTTDWILFISIAIVFIITVIYLMKKEKLTIKSIIKDPDKIIEIINKATDKIDKSLEKMDEDSKAKEKYYETRDKLKELIDKE